MTYTEYGLVEQPAINLLSQLDWDTAICWDESFGEIQGAEHIAFGRETRNDVVLFKRLTLALNKLNPNIPQRILQEAIDEVARDRSAMSTIAANEVIKRVIPTQPMQKVKKIVSYAILIGKSPQKMIFYSDSKV